ncbi:hypothetical protein AMD27_17570 (plasmid) [Acinetobacter sp. TGL-Y2]|uniref:hypothetical protein n=1 Tax=Acinetobacter sp. TGL-Y2 TaxID=1407071 RepID=UPI0007A646EA|nr:hypothetical protein [Acinetobacter sp. TGL-Y2]AMW80726.1 hypothetical protein AMD27_17570 [Acinetobacter sp. TGL-Y2]
MNSDSIKVLPIKLWQDIENFKASSINWLELYQDEFYDVIKQNDSHPFKQAINIKGDVESFFTKLSAAKPDIVFLVCESLGDKLSPIYEDLNNSDEIREEGKNEFIEFIKNLKKQNDSSAEFIKNFKEQSDSTAFFKNRLNNIDEIIKMTNQDPYRVIHSATILFSNGNAFFRKTLVDEELMILIEAFKP